MNDARTTVTMLLNWLEDFNVELASVTRLLETRTELNDAAIDASFHLLRHLSDDLDEQLADAKRSLTEGT